MLNTPLRQLTDLFSTLRAIVVGVRRGERLFAPEPGDQLFEGDQIYVITHTEDVNRTLEIFGKEIDAAGAGRHHRRRQCRPRRGARRSRTGPSASAPR